MFFLEFSPLPHRPKPQELQTTGGLHSSAPGKTKGSPEPQQ